MEIRRLEFRPSSHEADFIENNLKEGWSDFCHNCLKEKMGEVKKKHFDNITNKIMLICFGLVCYVLGFAVIDVVVYILLNIGAVILICSGFYLLIREIMMLVHMKRGT